MYRCPSATPKRIPYYITFRRGSQQEATYHTINRKPCRQNTYGAPIPLNACKFSAHVAWWYLAGCNPRVRRNGFEIGSPLWTFCEPCALSFQGLPHCENLA